MFFTENDSSPTIVQTVIVCQPNSINSVKLMVIVFGRCKLIKLR